MGKPVDRVLKFGGAALRDGPAVRRVVDLAARAQGRSVLVVSAHAGVTEALEDAWRATTEGRVAWDEVRVRHRSLVRELGLSEIVIDALLRELGTVLGVLAERGASDVRARDLVLSFGERLSARLVAAALRDAGCAAFAADAFDLGLTVGADGLPVPECVDRVRERLAAEPGLPVVTGFLALDGEGRVTTLGADGSDLTAVWLGHALPARRVELYKPVKGWLTVAPESLAGGVEIPRLARVLALELARRGANLLHPRALEIPCASEIALLDIHEPSRGTHLTDELPEPGRPVALVAEPDARGARITVVGGVGLPERWLDAVESSNWIEFVSAEYALTAVVPVGSARSVLAHWHEVLRSMGAQTNPRTIP